jgi:hypothetical protein
MRQIGGSGPTQVSALTPQATVNGTSLGFPSLSYGYKYGTDPMSNAHGFLTQHGSKQNNRNNQLGGDEPTHISVPQFPENFPQGTPNGANAAAISGVTTRAQAITNAKNDHYALTGGLKRKSRKTKSRKTKSRKTKSRKTKSRKTKSRKTKGRKTKGRKTKGRKYGGVGTPRSAAKKLQAATRRTLANIRRKKAATKKIQKKYKDYLDRTRPSCSICLESIINSPHQWHETCAPGHPLHQQCKQQMVRRGMTSCPSCRKDHGITNTTSQHQSLQNILERQNTLWRHRDNLPDTDDEDYDEIDDEIEDEIAQTRHRDNLPDIDDEDYDEIDDEIAQTRYTR